MSSPRSSPRSPARSPPRSSPRSNQGHPQGQTKVSPKVKPKLPPKFNPQGQTEVILKVTPRSSPRSPRSPVVAGLLDVAGGQQVEGEHCVLPVRLPPFRGVPDTAHHQFLNVAPDEVGPALVHDGNCDAALDALVEQVGAQTRHLLAVVHCRGHISVWK